ncbi:MAG: FGGY family carbohydrate kinase [Chitinophagaceae bacterium]
MINSTPVIAIFDVGKTNKKLFLFDEHYHIVYEESTQLTESIDEDGDNCEDLTALTVWITSTFARLTEEKKFDIKAVNFSAYGASFVHIMAEGSQLLPLYNYLKVYPEELQNTFYETYGGKEQLSRQTASPVSGSLNSGLQLYRIKNQKPEVYKTIRKSLHLPQYLSFLITNQKFSDITSIGCHTSLWDFKEKNYHDWVYAEGIDKILAPIAKGDEAFKVSASGGVIISGIGLHDSSAALIPYLINFTDPFILISTGTWCISLNPFNEQPLTDEELKSDCLCYLTYKGKPVKANRLFAGYEHEIQTKNIAAHFGVANDFYKKVQFNPLTLQKVKALNIHTGKGSGGFAELEAASFESAEHAYYQLMLNIMERQLVSTGMVLQGTTVKRLFVDGGFGKNSIFMNLLAAAFPNVEVFAASMAQATAMGAALAIHNSWNTVPLPGDMIELKFYSVVSPTAV